MKNIKPIILITLLNLVFCCLSFAQDTSKEKEEKAPNLEQFEMQQLLEKLESSERSYLPFLNRSSLSCGIYTLKAGATDHQNPHKQDEVYYVLEGKCKFTVEEKEIELKPGDVLFVAANAVHHFHDIEEDLKLLVFFSSGPID